VTLYSYKCLLLKVENNVMMIFEKMESQNCQNTVYWRSLCGDGNWR